MDPLAPAGLAISLITYGELWKGIEGSARPPTHAAAFERSLQTVDVLPLTRAIMRRFGQERRALRRSGQLIADLDLLIAATALHHDLILVTRNRTHFQRLPGLRLTPPR